jgi:ribosomal protein S18 acetylase RimI-like enzyme
VTRAEGGDAAARAVRRLAPADAEAFMALRHETLTEAGHAFGATPEDDPGHSREFVRAMLADVNCQAVFGAFDGEDLVGQVGFRRSTKAKERHRAGVWGMYVAPRARRRGVGRALLDALVAHARAEGVEQVALSCTDAATDAKRLYESAGFVVWGREPRALRHEGRDLDEFHLTLDVRGR